MILKAAFERWRERRAQERRDMAAIRAHPVLGKRCRLCGLYRYQPPGDRCHVTHDLWPLTYQRAKSML